jgi:hypothetical protein
MVNHTRVPFWDFTGEGERESKRTKLRERSTVKAVFRLGKMHLGVGDAS